MRIGVIDIMGQDAVNADAGTIIVQTYRQATHPGYFQLTLVVGLH